MTGIIEFIKNGFKVIKDFVFKYQTLSIIIITIIITAAIVLVLRGCK